MEAINIVYINTQTEQMSAFVNGHIIKNMKYEYNTEYMCIENKARELARICGFEMEYVIRWVH